VETRGFIGRNLRNYGLTTRKGETSTDRSNILVCVRRNGAATTAKEQSMRRRRLRFFGVLVVSLNFALVAPASFAGDESEESGLFGQLTELVQILIASSSEKNQPDPTQNITPMMIPGG
jgi:hypothetical protein